MCVGVMHVVLFLRNSCVDNVASCYLTVNLIRTQNIVVAHNGAWKCIRACIGANTVIWVRKYMYVHTYVLCVYVWVCLYYFRVKLHITTVLTSDRDEVNQVTNKRDFDKHTHTPIIANTDIHMYIHTYELLITYRQFETSGSALVFEWRSIGFERIFLRNFVLLFLYNI